MINSETKLKQTALGPIPEEWERFELGQFTEIIKNSYKPIASEKLQYIGLEHIDQQGLSLNSVGRSSTVKSNKFKFQNGDILFGKLRPYFRKVYRPKFSGVCSTDIWVLRAKKGFDQGWLFYLIAGQDFIKYASSGSSGTRMPRADWQYLNKTVWLVPPLPEQRRIASILASLDDKIELNRQMNKTLEEIASAIFKHWFVDFEFPNEQGKPYKSSGGKMVESELGMMPEVWRVGRLDDIMEFMYGKALKEADRKSGTVVVYGSSGIVGYHNAKLVNGPGIVIGRKGNVGSVHWVDRDFYPIDTTYYVKSSFALVYCLYLLKNELFFDSDSVVPGLNRQIAYQNRIVVPPQSIVDKFSEVATRSRENISSNELETLTLSKIRDSLLPRLMSGRIRV